MALGHRTTPLGPPNYKKNTGFPRSLTDGYAMLMSPNKGETAVHGCHCPCDMAVRMREIMLRPWVGVCVPLALSLHYFQGNFSKCNRIKFNLFFMNYCILWHFYKNSTARAYR